MNTVRPTAAPTRPVPTAPVPFVPRRERDFGTGYGRSSGYASERRYTSNWAPPRFRFA